MIFRRRYLGTSRIDGFNHVKSHSHRESDISGSIIKRDFYRQRGGESRRVHGCKTAANYTPRCVYLQRLYAHNFLI